MTGVQAGSWAGHFARRTRLRGGDELTAILAGGRPGVLSMTGGFPNPATFPTDVLDELAERALHDGAARQYAPVRGLPGPRAFLRDRHEALQGRRPDEDELLVTSGGMECIGLACSALLDPGDAVVVEAPTYLGALMAFGAAEADVHGVGMDDEGLRVDELAERLEAGLRPKLLYVIPDHQNPTGRTLSRPRRDALVELCRRHRVLVLEDVAYRELGFDGSALPSLWSLAPDVVVQAGTFSKILMPGVRLGWATGPAEVVAELAAAKQNTDQCAGALGQVLMEAYGRGGHFEAHAPAARALYARHWAALGGALERHMPAGVRWSRPSGGFFCWLALPDGLTAMGLRDAAEDAGVAYVPGHPFYPGEAGGAAELRLSFSHLGEDELAEAGRRLAGVIGAALG
jgi:2-aminoadipate transaminase